MSGNVTLGEMVEAVKRADQQLTEEGLLPPVMVSDHDQSAALIKDSVEAVGLDPDDETVGLALAAVMIAATQLLIPSLHEAHGDPILASARMGTRLTTGIQTFLVDRHGGA